ncbi:penicillin-binding protein 1C [Rhabdaerophilum sp. SD176]|uniref:penicillin-binding protein 1C n=1 Tax=Rhabdaerophilum sp. SD176 TaxID=2983548 RepID=UPI0024DF37AE|nr:penicillin-binding protein 1C [Rhabdaerophilum sp. SD176]
MGWRRRLAVAAGGLALLASLPLGFALYARGLPPLDLDALKERSTIVVDRNGKLLRPFVMADGRWRMPVSAAEVDPRFLTMLIAYEDQRFHQHGGVDPLALVRAGWQWLARGRIVSGGSTLSMQVARLVEPREARTLGAKLRQMARAIELERRVGKGGILDLYLSLAPYGGNLEGLRAASLAYFGKEPTRLSNAEAALLVALPQAPESRRPDRFPQRAEAARRRVIERMRSQNTLAEAELARAESEPVPERRRPFPHLAAHRAETLVAADPARRRHETTLERDWQVVLERLALERAEAQGPKVSVAIVVVENETGQVRASVGGADYFNAARWGGIDLTRASRSPGSALKPFIYALAFENGLAHPETMLEDRPQRFGTYAPDNFDYAFQGMVTARQALQMSLNLPAVELLQLVGAQRFISRLRQAGAVVETPDESAPGLAIGLGGLGISLQDLTMLYAGLARGGVMLPSTERQAQGQGLPSRFVGPVPAWYVGDILLGAPPPDNALQARIAYKTGTSYGYRDAWAVGFDRKHTIGIWVGQADNGAVPGLIGRKVAAPVLFDAFARIGLSSGPMPRPREALVASNASLPPPLRHIRQDIPKTALLGSRQALQIAFPPDGAAIDTRAERADARPSVMVKIAGGLPPFTLLLNGEPVGGQRLRREIEIGPEGLGFAQISVIDATGATERVTIRLQ